MAKKTRVKKKRVRLAFDEGLIFVHSSFNNTIVSLTDRAGNVLAWSSGGKIGNKGSRKSTPYAAQMAAAEVAKAGAEMGIQKVAKDYIKPGVEVDDSIFNLMEMVIRAYDPCLSCATHNIDSQMKLATLEVYDSNGNLINKL